MVGWMAILACSGKPDGPPGEGTPGAQEGTAVTTSPSSASWWSADADGRLTVRCADHDLVLDGLADGVLRLQYLAPGDLPDRRSFAVTPPPARAAATVAEGADGVVTLTTPELVATVDTSCRVHVEDAAGRVLLDDGLRGGWFAEGDRVGVRRATPPEERFYGFGERNGGLQKRGERFTFWNTDAYDATWGAFRPDQDPLYVSIPFFLTLRDGAAAGVFTDVPWRMNVDVAATDREAWEITAEGGRIDQYVVAGPTPADVVRRYTALTGRIQRPPLWALGYHQCRWGYWPDDRLRELAATFRSLRIPADVLWLDIQHLDGFRTFTFDPVGFPDPAGLAADLADEGFRLVAIADPGLKEEPGWPVWDGAVAGDHLLAWPSGEIFVGTVWPGPSGFPDFSRSATRSWWAGHVGALAELGVDGIWLDVNEPTTFPEGGAGLSIDDAVVADGDGLTTTMAEIHNVYGLLEAEATAAGLLAAAPDRRPFVLSRAGYAGIQRHAATWTGDVSSTWEGLSGSLPMLLNLGLSGQPFAGSDVGGYSGRGPDGTPTSPELFARWMALGAVTPFFRGHVTSGAQDQEPWAFGTEVTDISRIHVSWRYRLLPYLYSLFDEASRTGAPILRPMLWDWPGDEGLVEVDDQAMLGPWLLVAPVLEAGATSRTLTLPAGRWFELHSGAVAEGPGPIEVGVTLQALPVYVRAGAILPSVGARQHTGEPVTGPLHLDLYPDDTPSGFVLVEDAGDGFGAEARTSLSLVATGAGARLEATRTGAFDPGPRDLAVRIRRVDHGATGVRLDGVSLAERQSAEEVAALGGWWWDADDLSLQVRFADPGGFALEADYDRALIADAPPVEIALRVAVPLDTPADPVVHVVSDANGWQHAPLAWDPDAAGVAVGTIAVPRGAWYRFKYSRGDWCTIEKYPDCVEAEDRYAFGAADLDRDDVVFGWRDDCEVCP
jgi:alpha-glucosidase